MKLDFGTEVNGYIIDSAFTISFDPQFDNLLMASREATYAGIRAAGLDARLGEIGGIIEEVINSYEVTVNGKTVPGRVLLKISSSGSNA
jgi:methionyl aminopeptidase